MSQPFFYHMQTKCRPFCPCRDAEQEIATLKAKLATIAPSRQLEQELQRVKAQLAAAKEHIVDAEERVDSCVDLLQDAFAREEKHCAELSELQQENAGLRAALAESKRRSKAQEAKYAHMCDLFDKLSALVQENEKVHEARLERWMERCHL